MSAKKPPNERDLPEGLRRQRTSAIPAPQSWPDRAGDRRPAPGPGRNRETGGITQDERGQVQPKDKRTAQRS